MVDVARTDGGEGWRPGGRWKPDAGGEVLAWWVLACWGSPDSSEVNWREVNWLKSFCWASAQKQLHWSPFWHRVALFFLV